MKILLFLVEQIALGIINYQTPQHWNYNKKWNFINIYN